MVLSGFLWLSLLFSVFHPGTSPVSHYLGLGEYLLSGLLTRLPSQADFTYQPPCHLLLLWTAWHDQDGEAAVRLKCVLQVFMGWNLISTMRLHIMGNLIRLRIHSRVWGRGLGSGTVITGELLWLNTANFIQGKKTKRSSDTCASYCTATSQQEGHHHAFSILYHQTKSSNKPFLFIVFLLHFVLRQVSLCSQAWP